MQYVSIVWLMNKMRVPGKFWTAVLQVTKKRNDMDAETHKELFNPLWVSDGR